MLKGVLFAQAVRRKYAAPAPFQESGRVLAAVTSRVFSELKGVPPLDASALLHMPQSDFVTFEDYWDLMQHTPEFPSKMKLGLANP